MNLIKGSILIRKKNDSGYSLILSDLAINNKEEYLVCIATTLGGSLTKLGVEVARTANDLSSFVCSNAYDEKPLLVLIEDDFMDKYKKRVLGFVELYDEEEDDMTFVVPVYSDDKIDDLHFKKVYELRKCDGGTASLVCSQQGQEGYLTIQLDRLFEQRQDYLNKKKEAN